MNMPGFTAEQSIYNGNLRYRAIYSSGYKSNDHMIVSPQGCGFFKYVSCYALITGCVFCGAFYPNVPAMIACYAACLGATFAYCSECIDIIDIPSNGGSGGGGGHPTPHPITCEPGYKCCDHDEQGNCTLCIWHSYPCT